MELKKIIFNIIFILVLISTYVVLHEGTHGQIFRLNGCDYKYGINNQGLYTKALEPCEMTEEHILAHAINEIVGYNVIIFMIFILWMLFIK